MAEPTENEVLEFLIRVGFSHVIGSPGELANGEPFAVVLNDCYKHRFSRERWSAVPTHVVVPYAQNAKATSEPWDRCAEEHGPLVWEMHLSEGELIAFYRLSEPLVRVAPRRRYLNVREGFVLRRP